MCIYIYLCQSTRYLSHPYSIPSVSGASLPEVRESDAQGELEMEAATSDVVIPEVADTAEEVCNAPAPDAAEHALLRLV